MDKKTAMDILKANTQPNKDEWFSSLKQIYSTDLCTKPALQKWIKDAIGAYPESTKWHRLSARYISNAAIGILSDNKQKSPAALHTFVTSKKSGLTHEHMTPKAAIKSVLDRLGKDAWTKDNGKKAREVLDQCSQCAIITQEEDGNLRKEFKDTHPGIEDGNLDSNFDVCARYKQAQIDLSDSPFKPIDYLDF